MALPPVTGIHFNPVNSPPNVNGAAVNGPPGPPDVATEASGPRRYVEKTNK